MPQLILAASGAILWLTFFMAVYVSEILTCRAGLPISGIRIWEGALALLTLGALAALARRDWHNLKQAPDDSNQHFFAYVGLMICGISGAATILVALSLTGVPPCLNAAQ